MSLDPADNLVGVDLQDGWHVIRRIPGRSGATGGCFSRRYEVVGRDGTKAFLKALSYRSALRDPDPARALQPLIQDFNFERDLLFSARQNRPASARQE